MTSYEATIDDVNKVQEQCLGLSLLQIRQALNQTNGSVEESVQLLNQRELQRRLEKKKGKPGKVLNNLFRYQDLRQALWSGGTAQAEQLQDANAADTRYSSLIRHIASVREEAEQSAAFRTTFQACTTVFPDVSRRYLNDLIVRKIPCDDLTNTVLDVLSRSEYPLQINDPSSNASVSRISVLNEKKETIADGEASVCCGCCFSDVSVTAVVRCTENHEFCMECVRRASLEHVFAQRKLSALGCLEMGGCDGEISEA